MSDYKYKEGEYVWADRLEDPYYYPAKIKKIYEDGNTQIYSVEFCKDKTVQFLRIEELQSMGIIGRITSLSHAHEGFWTKSIDVETEKITLVNEVGEDIIVSFAEFGTAYFPSTHTNPFADKENVRLSCYENVLTQPLVEKIDMKGGLYFDDMTWKLNHHINILLGKNGYGKTYLLRTLVAFLQNEREVFSETLANTNVDEKSELKVVLETSTLDDNNKSTKININSKLGITPKTFLDIAGHTKIPLLAIPSVRYIAHTDFVDVGDYTFIENGGNLMLDQKKFSAAFKNVVYDWALTADAANPTKKQPAIFTENERFIIISEVFKELVEDEKSNNVFSFDSIVKSDTGNTKVMVKVHDDKDATNLTTTSQGTFSVLAIVSIIYQFLNALHKEREAKNKLTHTKVVDQQAIVCIDELDAHLHPTWQRKIVNMLHRTFPNVQFIITVHSPFAVQDRKRDEIFFFKKGKAKDSEDPRYKIYPSPVDFVGKDIYEVLETVFEFENIKFGEDTEATIKKYNANEEIDKLISNIQKLKDKMKGKINNLNEDEREQLKTAIQALEIIHHIKTRKS